MFGLRTGTYLLIYSDGGGGGGGGRGRDMGRQSNTKIIRFS